MHQIFNYILSNWVEWLFLAVTGFLTYAYKLLAKRQKKESEKNAAICEGVQALLRDRIIQAYNYYHGDKRCCPIYARESIERLYTAYHNLGGNGTITGLVEEIRDLPTEKGA